jgi:hypothetical protein
MVDVELYEMNRNDRQPRRFATLHVNGQQLTIDGDEPKVREIIDRVSVPDLDSGATLVFADDPERWARFLPAALRGPYLTATCAQEFPTPAAITKLDQQASSTAW